jgi:3',5'-cyclic AMP phosphodiesterase CpdA
MPAHYPTRRDLLKCSPAALLATGLWPGVLAAGEVKTEAFTFLVVNDLHSLDDKCGPWFEKVAASMSGHVEKPELLLVDGDLTENAKPAQFALVKDALNKTKLPMKAVPGNHDLDKEKGIAAYNDAFPNSMNYAFEHRGWQFIALDSTQGTEYQNTSISADTLKWVERQLPKLDRKKPLILITHFPLGEGVKYRPKNADDLLKRFLDFNVRAVFNGHYHAFTEKKVGDTVLTTNRCCAFARNNHDGTKEKGYFLVSAKEGKLERKFIEVKL